MKFWIGTSGYSYADWVGPFYPPGTRPGRMLGVYARHFPLVELNFTFYRLPTPEILARIADQTPEGFQFLVKLPKTLSHDCDPRDLEPFQRAVAAMESRRKLLGLLCQLPQASHNDEAQRRWLERLSGEFSDSNLAVEFRHPSWARPEVADWLRSHQLGLVAVDAPNLPNLYPSGLVQSNSTVYVRFHSRNATNWYRSDKERYDYNYDDAELTGWIDALKQSPLQTDRVMLLFNNCHRSQAAANAERIRELIERLLPSHELVQAFARPETGAKQGLLFDQ